MNCILDLWVKPLLRTDRQWAWVLCADPEDWVGSRVLASSPEDAYPSCDRACQAARAWADQRGRYAGTLA